jgi:hypothetical protein
MSSLQVKHQLFLKAIQVGQSIGNAWIGLHEKGYLLLLLLDEQDIPADRMRDAEPVKNDRRPMGYIGKDNIGLPDQRVNLLEDALAHFFLS